MARAANDRRSSILPEYTRVHGEKRIALVSFLATCFSVFVVYFIGWQPEGQGFTVAAAHRAFWFTVTLMSILLAHEMGHWLTARRCGFRLSLPVFIPFPFLVGTLGAIIRMEQTPKDRSSLLRMGAAGPLCGVGVITLLMAARLLHGVGAEIAPGMDGSIRLGAPGLWALACRLLTGNVTVISPYDPVAFGAWIGCLVTAMNLLPFGQLDGGHIARGLMSAHVAHRLTHLVTLLLVFAGFWWAGWFVWAGILWLIRADKGVDISTVTPPSRSDRLIGVGCLLCFCVCFMLTPFQLMSS